MYQRQACLSYTQFLSTPSARRATRPTGYNRCRPPISIHALREEGDRSVCPSTPVFLPISIHALREEGDLQVHNLLSGATPISIHALREEGDGISVYPMQNKRDFYPRPPRGGRPTPSRSWRPSWTNFYPRPPRGGRQLLIALRIDTILISIHALREEGDP